MSNWNIDPTHSQIEFGVKHMMFTTVRGQFAAFEGAIAFDQENPANSSVEVKIDAASIDTGVEDRDNHLRSGDFFDVEQFPAISFRILGASWIDDSQLPPEGARASRTDGVHGRSRRRDAGVDG